MSAGRAEDLADDDVVPIDVDVDAVTSKSGPKKRTAAAKTAGRKKAGPKKATAKKAPTKKRAAPKKATAKKATAKKATAKKAPSRKKATPPKTAAKKTGPKKSTAGKPVSERATEPAGSDTRAVPIDEDLWAGDWSDLGSSWSETSTGSGDPGARPGGPSSADRADMFQTAALDLIAAARTALDTAEELVTDPSAIGTAIDSLRSIAVEALRAGAQGARPTQRDDEDDDDFQSIRVDDD